MLVFILLVLCVVGFLLTMKHCVYRTKVRNETRYWMEQRIGPRVMGQQGYRDMHLVLLEKLRGTPDGRRRIKVHDHGDLAFRLDPYNHANKYPSDYPDIIAYSVMFPLYWGFWIPVHVIGGLCTSSSKKTPGQLREEKQFEDYQRQYEDMKTRHLYEETERLRKEQDGE